MIAFKPDTDNRTTRVRIVVPTPIQEILERTYADQTVCELSVKDQADAEALVRLLQVHANRRGLRLHWEAREQAVSFKMRDKRPYVKRSPRWDRATT